MATALMVRRRPRAIALAVVTTLVAALLMGLPGRAGPAHADPVPLFDPAACLEAQTAVTWRITDPPVSVNNRINWDSNSLDQPGDLHFTALSSEVKVASPGVLGNDYIQLSGGRSMVPDWNANHGATEQITAELVRAPDHASSFTFKTDGSFEWHPAAGWFGSDSFEYVAELNGMCGLQATVTIGPTSKSYAVDDEFASFGGAQVDATLFGVLDNDLHSQDVMPQVSGVGQSETSSTTHIDSVQLAHGVLHMIPHGTFTYQPDPGFRGIDTFYYWTDIGGPPISTPPGKVSLLILDAPPSSQPRAMDDHLSTVEDTALDITPSDLLANDIDAGAITAAGTNAVPATTFKTWHGTVTISRELVLNLYSQVSKIVYTPDPDFHGVDFFDYWVATSVLPGGTRSDQPARAYINVTAVAEAPIANPDTATTLENTPVVVPVRANDQDDDPLAFSDIWGTPISQCGCYTYTVDNVKGTITITPNPEFVGAFYLGYALHDGDGLLSPTTNVHVTVNRDDAVDDRYTTAEDTPLAVPAAGVRTNDEQALPTSDVPEVVGQPQHGTVDLRPDGSFRYDPAVNYNGPDFFTYAYRDNVTGTLGDVGTAWITVTAVNDAPTVAFNVACSTTQTLCLPGELRDVTEGGTVTFNGYVDDVEFNPGVLTVAWGDGQTSTYSYPCADPTNPGCVFTTQSTYTRVPACIPPPTGPSTCPSLYFRLTHRYVDIPASSDAAFTITATANDGTPSGPRTTTAWVRNVAPQITLLSDATVRASEGQPVTVSATVTDPGADSPPLLVDWGDGGQPAQASLVCSTTFTDCHFAATHTYVKRSTPYVVTLSADDGHGGVDTKTVSVTFDRPPTAADVARSVDEDTVLTVPAPGLLASASDPDGDPITLASHTEPTHGQLEVSADGAWKYTPGANFHGSDSFTYTVAAAGAQASGTVSITVNTVNDPPTAADASVTTTEDTPVVVAPDVADPDGDSLTLAVADAPGHGSVSVTSAGFRYTPGPDFNGSDSFTYTATDGSLTSAPATVTVTVTPVNDPPTARDLAITTKEDTSVTTAGDVSDVDSTLLTLGVVDGPAHGSVAVVAGGLRYTPDLNWSGQDSFTYRASDGAAQSSAATVSVTVTAVDDAPDIGQLADVTGVYSDPITPVMVTATDVDSAPATLSFSASGLPAELVLTDAHDGTATISGMPTVVPGSYPVTVKVCDEDNVCASTGLTVNVVAESARVRLSPTNPYAVAIGTSGAPAVTVAARITDAADGTYGDVSRITAGSVRMMLVPTGGGTTTTCPVTITRRVAATSTAPGFVDVSCTFASGLPVDVYDLSIEVAGSFTGTAASLLSVYDPQARGATGAGFIHLGNGNIAQFAFWAAADGKKVKGKVAVLERNPDGVIVNTVKGVNLSTLAITAGFPRSAKVTGKAVVDGVGNYAFVLTGTDPGAGSSAPDTVALQLTAPSGAPAVPSMTFTATAVASGGMVAIQ